MNDLMRHGQFLRRGFTLVEAMTAVIIVTVACSAMLLSVNQAMQASEAGQGTNRANLLAQDLMNEISTVRWSDPTEPGHWGLESDERNSKTRATFDDLDDYDRWQGPPQTRDGRLYDALQSRLFPDVKSHEYSQYTLAVSVKYVSSSGQELASTKTSLYRRVTIEITHPNHAPHKLSQIFSDPAPLLGRTHWFDPKAVEPPAKVKYVP